MACDRDREMAQEWFETRHLAELINAHEEGLGPLAALIARAREEGGGRRRSTCGR